jgi:hypothetical protein
MGATKDLWISEIEQTVDDYACALLTFEEAAAILMRLGLDLGEAHDLLGEAVS